MIEPHQADGWKDARVRAAEQGLAAAVDKATDIVAKAEKSAAERAAAGDPDVGHDGDEPPRRGAPRRDPDGRDDLDDIENETYLRDVW